MTAPPRVAAHPAGRLRSTARRLLVPFLLTGGLWTALSDLVPAAFATAGPETADTAAPRPAERNPAADWWTEDVWTAPDRPFLYYGEPKKDADLRPGRKDDKTAPAPEDPADPADFSRFKTIEALKAERERRLNAAIMAPTEENMAAYQAINSHVLQLAGNFSAAWQTTRFAHPEYDWTATHPTAGFAATELADTSRQARDAALRALARDTGLLLLADPADPKTALAAGALAAFARQYGFPVLVLTVNTGSTASDTPADTTAVFAPLSTLPGFEGLQPDAGQAARWGISLFPAIVIAPAPGALDRNPVLSPLRAGLGPRNRRLPGAPVATGVVSAEELGRRLAALLPIVSGNTQPGLPRPSPATDMFRGATGKVK